MRITLENAPKEIVDLITGIANRNRSYALQQIAALNDAIRIRRTKQSQLEQVWTSLNQELEELQARKKQYENELSLTTASKDPATGIWSIKTADEPEAEEQEEHAAKLGRERDSLGRFRKAASI